MATIVDVEFDHVKFAGVLEGSTAENARKLGISRQHLTNIIKGNRRPSANLLLKLQQIYKIAPSDLIRKN